nr:MAG TPA: hypothetical protein [Caudoviricetes sp.]
MSVRRSAPKRERSDKAKAGGMAKYGRKPVEI